MECVRLQCTTAPHVLSLLAKICLTDRKKTWQRELRNLRGVVGKLINLCIRDCEFDQGLLQSFG